MKCPKCNGSGDIPRPNGTKLFGLTEVMTCDLCNGTGEVEMTNEEYIRNCSTEELAKFLQSVNKYCDYMHNCKKCPTKCKNGGWIGWLKEIHDG